VSYSDTEMYGDDLPRDARRWAREELSGELHQLRAQLGQLHVTSNQQRCQAALDGDPELASKWRTINEDPKFIAWLGQEYDLAGCPRMRLFADAYNSGDQWRVVNFFKAFIASRTPARERTPERLPMENPTAAHRTSVKPSSDHYAAKRRIWSPAEITKFYSDVRKGYYDHRDHERLQIEKEIFDAAKQGRVPTAHAKMPGDQF
jgi:hypothetical protein